MDNSKNLKIVGIYIIKNDLEVYLNYSLVDKIDYYLNDFYFEDKLFYIQNEDYSFNVFYLYFINVTYNDKKNYLILKESKKYNVEFIINDMIEKINDSNINNQEKSKLKDILVYNGKEDEKLEKLIDINKTILKFLDDKNKDVYNKLKNKINKNEDKYMLNSNYIYKTFKIINNNLDNFDLNAEEKEEIKYSINLKNLCNDLLQIFTNFIIFNSKINNIYNYKNNFLFFMGENYLINIYSLKEKKFIILDSINIFTNVENYNNFEIIQMVSDKVIFNDSENKTIYFFETINNYDFCFLKKTIKYDYNLAIDNNYLLYDKISNDNFEFSFIDLLNLDIIKSVVLELLNLKIDFNIPKIISNKEFKKFISIYDDNQICITEYIYESEKINENNIIIDEINLIKDNKSSSITPSIDSYFSTYSD